MDSIAKSYALVLLGIMAFSWMTVEYASAQISQTIPRPSVPEFTAKVVDTNLEVTIINQPLTPFDNGSYPNLYYMFRFKDNNTRIGEWFYDPMYFVLPSTYGGYHKASNSDFTTVSLSLEGKQFPSGQIDIQVTALVGYQYPTGIENGTVYAFDGHYSGWSYTQYVTIPINTSLPTPSVFVPAPSLDIIQPQNFTYSGEDAKAIPLMIYATVLVSAPAIVSISYSLDESQNITFIDLLKTGEFPSQTGKAVAYHTEMLSLDNLTDGTHILKAYSLDTNGNGMKSTAQFSVTSTSNTTGTPTPNQLTKPTFLAIIVTVAVLLFVIVSILLFRRHRETMNKVS
jgi:hypothetical protein